MRKKPLLLTLLFSALSVAGAFGEPVANADSNPLTELVNIKPTKDSYALIDTATLKKLLDTNPEDLVVVDARNPEEYQEVHIKDAINVPQKKFKKYAHLLPEKKSARIIFYCNGIKCGKSKKAAKAALKMGYTRIFVYAEGMPVWEEKGLPIYAGPEYEKRIETDKLSPKELNTLIQSKADTFTLTAPAAGSESTTFSSWSGCDATDASARTCTVTMSAGKTVTASFVIKSYTVTPSAGAHGSFSPSTQQAVDYGGTTDFTVTPEIGYGIDTVEGCGGALS
ncbi:MAG: rhodanese-like domain-containing protein, partial [Candidatus Electrothrix sp. AR1]|nr:rhodanese-like domain-containing protein [Candidatus Electrothrix sp. AR1]